MFLETVTPEGKARFYQEAGNMGLLPAHGESILSNVSSGGGGFDWGNVINQGFQFGQTFLQAKYAKDASKYAGGYYPQGQSAGNGGGQYQQIAPTSQQQNTTVSNTAGNFAASFTRFIENNIGILAIGGIFLFAWQRQPKRS